MQYTFSEIYIAPFLSDPFHLCTDLYNKPLLEVHFYKAIVCGIPPRKEFYPGLLGFGLWHLIVVSAGHWSFLKFFFDQITFKKLAKKTKLLSLVTLIGLAGINPPIAKSITEWFLKIQNKKYGWNLLESEIIFLSAFITILFYRITLSELFSSALLSILASWNLSLSLMITKKTRPLPLRIFQVQILIFPLVISFGQSFLLSFLGNLFFAPLIGVLLFPSSLLTAILTEPFDSLNHLLIQWINQSYEIMKPSFEGQQNSTSIPLLHYFGYLFVFQLWLYFYELRKNRKGTLA